MQFVTIPVLRGDEEIALIKERIIYPWLSNIENKIGDKNRELVLTTAQRLQGIAERIRDLTGREPASQFTACELGSRLVMNAVHGFLVELQENDCAVADNIDHVVDTLVNVEYLRQLESCGSDALRVMLDEVLLDSVFPQSAATLKYLLGKRRIY